MRQFFVMIALVCASHGCDTRQHARDAEAEPVAPAELPESVSLTDDAANALRAMAQQHNLDGEFFLRIAVANQGGTEHSYGLEITRKLDPATDVVLESKGIRIVVKRANMPLVLGGTIEFRKDADRPGFQFRRPNAVDDESDQVARSAAAPRPALASDPASSTRQHVPAYGIRRPYASPPNASSDLRLDAYSNIHAEDYVGPEACGKCHSEQYDLWRRHPHSKMNLDARAESVAGDFSGTTVDYADGSVLFDESNGDFRMTVFHKGAFVRRYRVTRTVGSRVFQMYIGVQSEGPEPSQDTIYREERKLPFAYWIQRQQWFPEMYDEPVAPPEYETAGRLTDAYAFHTRNFRPVWEESCLWCHNTYPYEARLQKGLVGFPRKDISLTHITKPVPHGRIQNSYSLPPSDLVTLGISCESCHFGGREHALEQREIRFLPSSEALEFPKATADLVVNARSSPYVVNGICAQCHAVRQPKFPNSASAWNSAEALDLQSGACKSAIRCIDCHNPHQAGPKLGGGPDRIEHVQACLRCHDEYSAPDAAAAHSRHLPSNQVSCLDCHMPRIVHGLHDIVRTHQISSPTDARMLSKGAPNACNLCHLDRSITWTLDALQAGWARKIEATDNWKIWYGGSLSGPVGIAYLRHQAPMARQVAADAYARSPLGKATLPQILPALNDDNPPTRMFGLFAIERILGRQLDPAEYTPWSSPSVRAKQVDALARTVHP